MHEETNGRRTSGLKTSLTIWLIPKRGDIRSQRRAEEFWCERVKTTRSRYKSAEVQLRQVVAAKEKWPLAEPDGSALVHAARLEELDARNEYVKALKVFTGLLLHGENS